MEIGKGKHIIVKMLYKTEPNDSGIRRVFFELNGQTRVIEVKDRSYQVTKAVNAKAETDLQVGSPLQGRLAAVKVKAGDSVTEGQPLFVIEAMKMETTVSAPVTGVVKKVYLEEGDMVEQDDLVVELA